MEIEWQPEAIENVKKIYIFYLSKNERVADKILADINTSVERLTIFPKLAAKEPLLAEYEVEFRSLVVRRIFKVVYYMDESNDKIAIITVFDCRQDPQKLKERVKKVI